jgi:hypothetical protein
MIKRRTLSTFLKNQLLKERLSTKKKNPDNLKLYLLNRMIKKTSLFEDGVDYTFEEVAKTYRNDFLKDLSDKDIYRLIHKYGDEIKEMFSLTVEGSIYPDTPVSSNDPFYFMFYRLSEDLFDELLVERT